MCCPITWRRATKRWDCRLDFYQNGATSTFTFLHNLRRFFSYIVVSYFSVAVEKYKFPAAPFRIQSCPTIPLSGYSPIHTGTTTVPEIRFLNFLLLTSSFKNFRPHCQQLKTGTSDSVSWDPSKSNLRSPVTMLIFL
jgi:hypothetical protein